MGKKSDLKSTDADDADEEFNIKPETVTPKIDTSKYVISVVIIYGLIYLISHLFVCI